jgi:hypothetical protein
VAAPIFAELAGAAAAALDLAPTEPLQPPGTVQVARRDDNGGGGAA